MTTFEKVMACMLLSACYTGTALAQNTSQTPNDNPYILTVKDKPYLLRSYLMFDQKKRTHVISVGSPDKINYSYDLKQGALLQVWRGPFMDVKEMWHDRGEPQLAKPLGNVLTLSGAPFIAVLADKDAAWPDSIAFDDLQNKGYVLDKSKMPAFLYASNGAEVNDNIALTGNGAALERTLTISNTKEDLYCRIATASSIKSSKSGEYEIGNKSYSIKIEKDLKPVIRNTKKGQELIVPVKKGTSTITYSLTW